MKFSNEPFLGIRPKKQDGTLEEKYVWETFRQVEELARQLGSGILNKNLVVEKKQYLDYNIKPIAVYAQNCREWILVDIACALYGLTLVPIYDTLG